MGKLLQLLQWISTATPEQVSAFEAKHPGLLDSIGSHLGGASPVDHTARRDAEEDLARIVEDRRRLLLGAGGELVVNTLAIGSHCLQHDLELPDGVRQRLVEYLRRKAKLDDQQWGDDPQAALAELHQKYLTTEVSKKRGRPSNTPALAVAVCALENGLPIPADLQELLVSCLDQFRLSEDDDVRPSAFRDRTEEARCRNETLLELVKGIQSNPRRFGVGQRKKCSMVNAADTLLRRSSKISDWVGSAAHREKLAERIRTARPRLTEQEVNAIIDGRCHRLRKGVESEFRRLGITKSITAKENEKPAAASLARRLRMAEVGGKQLEVRAERHRRLIRLKQLLRQQRHLSREERHLLVREKYRAEE